MYSKQIKSTRCCQDRLLQISRFQSVISLVPRYILSDFFTLPLMWICLHISPLDLSSRLQLLKYDVGPLKNLQTLIIQ